MTVQQKMILTGVAAALLGFAIGAGWQYASARGYADELESTRDALTFQRLEATLGAATIEAQRGSYEIARQLASSFFSGLQGSVEAAAPDRRQAFAEILQHRDVIITALSRSDPQSGPLLAQLFVRYRIALDEPVGPGADAPPPAATGQ